MHTHLGNTQRTHTHTHTLLRHTLETEAINCEECEKIAEAVAFCASDTFNKGHPGRGERMGEGRGERRKSIFSALSSQLSAGSLSS